MLMNAICCDACCSLLDLDNLSVCIYVMPHCSYSSLKISAASNDSQILISFIATKSWNLSI